MAMLKDCPSLRSLNISPVSSSPLNDFGFPPAAPLALSLLAAGLIWPSAGVQAQAVDFGSVNVYPSGATTPAPCSATLSVDFTVPATGTLGTPRVYTQGAPNLDFALASGSTCVGAVTEGESCTVNVAFAPIAPGARNGAIQLIDGSGNMVAENYIYGTGVSPAIAYGPASQVAISSGHDFHNPWSVAVDASGDLFVGNSNAVEEILAVNGSIPAHATMNVLSGGFSIPRGLAVDGNGNLFLADFENHAVKEILAVNGSIPANPAVTTLGSGFYYPPGLAVDGNGNVFVANGNDAVYEIQAVNGSIPANPAIRALSTGFTEAADVAVDGSGNVFVADNDTTSVYEILAVNGSIPADPAVRTLAGPFHSPGGGLTYLQGVAVDSAGNVFFVTSNTVYELLAVNGSIPANPAIVTLNSAFFGQLEGLAVDARGNVFVADYDNGIFELPRSKPPSLSFPSTPVGGTSSPQSIQFQNIGNTTLSGSGGFSDTADFTVVPGSGTPPDCDPATLSLAPGAECNLSISFTPEREGAVSATLTLSDNALDGHPAKQAIQLAYHPAIAQLSATTLPFDMIAFGASETLPLTITNIGAGTLTIATSINGPSYKIASSTCGAGVAASSSCALQVEFAPVAIGPHYDALTLQTNGPTNPTVSLQGHASGVGTEMESALQFGTIPFGSTKVLPLTVTNYGVSGTVTVGTSINGPSYKVLANAQNTCLAGIASGQSCILPIQFDPAAVGAHNDILTLTPSAGAAPSQVHIDGTAD
jgi:sugar lactone lactonase YvrE